MQLAFTQLRRVRSAWRHALPIICFGLTPQKLQTIGDSGNCAAVAPCMHKLRHEIVQKGAVWRGRSPGTGWIRKFVRRASGGRWRFTRDKKGEEEKEEETNQEAGELNLLGLLYMYIISYRPTVDFYKNFQHRKYLEKYISFVPKFQWQWLNIEDDWWLYNLTELDLPGKAGRGDAS